MARPGPEGENRLHQTVIANAEHDDEGFKYVFDLGRPKPFADDLLEAVNAMALLQKIAIRHLEVISGCEFNETDVGEI